MSVVAIIGATGAVGRAIVAILEQRKFPVSKLLLFASEKSVGVEIPFQGSSVKVQALSGKSDFAGVDFAFFSAGSRVSSAYAEKIAVQGAWVIDNSSFFRMRTDVPLVVPEVNAADLKLAQNHRLIANPNCTTAQMVMVLKPIYDHFGIKRVVVSSYQAVSGKGQSGIDELKNQISDFVSERKSEPKAFAHPIAFNCIPHIDTFLEDGSTGEEQKVVQETKKILGNSKIRVSATCVRVPVLNGHSESVNIQTERAFEVEEIREILTAMPGVRVVDDVKKNLYPLAMSASGNDEVLVGRIRRDTSFEPGEQGLNLWIVADNLRKGAALNAVQIAEKLSRK